MAIKLNENSYVTLDQANAYFADRTNAQAFLSLDNNAKEDLLITATRYLDDTNEYVGVAVSTSQPLAWPRTGTYYEPRYSNTVALPTSEVPDRLKRATYEMALHLAENPDNLTSRTTLDKIKVGSIELSGLQSMSKVPSQVRSVVKPLLGYGSTNLPWRAW